MRTNGDKANRDREPGMVRIAGVRFIGATLWTDLLLEGKADEIGAHMRVSREIADFTLLALDSPDSVMRHGLPPSLRPTARPGWLGGPMCES